MSAETWVTGLAGTGVGGVIVWLGKALLEGRKHREERMDAAVDRQAKLNQHRDQLALQLLEAANAQVAALRAEMRDRFAEEEQRIERRLAPFVEAVRHVEALLEARDTGAWESAAHHAKLFLSRVTVLNEARGMAANRVQRQRAAEKLGRPGDMGEIETPDDTAH